MLDARFNRHWRKTKKIQHSGPSEQWWNCENFSLAFFFGLCLTSFESEFEGKKNERKMFFYSKQTVIECFYNRTVHSVPFFSYSSSSEKKTTEATTTKQREREKKKVLFEFASLCCFTTIFITQYNRQISEKCFTSEWNKMEMKQSWTHCTAIRFQGYSRRVQQTHTLTAYEICSMKLLTLYHNRFLNQLNFIKKI